MSKYRFAKKLACRKIAGETFIVDPDNRILYQPQGAGERIWELIGKGLNAEAIAEELCKEYDVTFDNVLEDTEKFIEELSACNIIEPIS